MKKTRGCLVLAVAIAATGFVVQRARAAGGLTMVPAADLKSESTDPGMRGGKVTALWGDRNKGPHGSVFRFPSQMTTAVHSHSVEIQGVVMSGELQLWPEGKVQADTKPLPAGSYFVIPAGFKHVLACVPSDDCAVYITQKGKFDFKPVAPPAPAPAPAKKK